ncbi:hypothetical protein LCI18_003792 [Fusarium solani-melongenae]|uniref:Uncharacterized protein n=1 Tax=Fusarium solani subsp. cucurbitae TaxID=2747967 RepID=A0ACD3YVE9_FUSSC|nr:hypothetical protein LCI18_003792 [Fusarium solani-melongenae]
MPLIKRGPGRRNSTESAGARGAGDDVYITDSRDAEPDPPRPRVHSYAPSRPESNYGQFLVPGNTNDPQWQSRFSQRFQSSSQGQERTQRYPPNSYPSQRIRYAATTGMGQNNSSRYRRESAGSYRRPTTTGDPSSSTYPLPGYSSNGYPTVSQSFSESNRYYDTAPPEPTRAPRPPPRPLTPPAEVPTPTPRTDPTIRRLETELAAFRAREEERRAKDERKRLEENIRQESEAVIQQMKQQLEKAEQEKEEQVEQARAQGKQDAQNRFYQERLAEQEKQQEREELRKQIEMDVRAELEAEREAEMAEREARERLSQEIQKTAMDSMLERLEEALALSKEKLLQDTEMDKDLLLAEVQTSITSHLRQSLVVSGPRQEHGHASSSRAESRSKSRPQSSLHHVECTSVADTSCVRPQSPSSQGDSETDDKEPPPPAPDVPRAACDSEEEEEDMTDHPGYSQGGWGFMQGSKSQRDSRIQDGRDMDSDYQAREKLPFMALVDRVADALMDRFGIRPKWRAPGHTTLDDTESGQRYRAMKRRSIDNDTYSDLSDEELPYGDESAVHGDVRDRRLEHEEPNHISHPHEPPHLYAQPIEGIRDTSRPSSGASLDPLPFSIADDPNMSVVDDVETQPDDTVQKLLEANNSIGRDTSSDSDVASIAGSDSTIFHEAPESLTDYSTVSNDYTKGSFDEDRFGSETSSMGDMKQLVKFNGDVVDE